jgi:hypothetical protein
VIEYVLKFGPQFCYIAGSLLFIIGTVWGMLK